MLRWNPPSLAALSSVSASFALALTKVPGVGEFAATFVDVPSTVFNNTEAPAS